MHLQKIGLTFLFVLAATVSIPITPSVPVPCSTKRVWAQTTDARKAEADRVLQQGTEQVLKTNQFQAALQSCQKVLPIYREIKDHLGEAKALACLGGAYIGLKDISRATPFLQRSLAIAQEIKNPQLEAVVQKLLSLAPRIVEAERLAELGTQQLNTNQFQAALQTWQQALPIYREIKSRLGEAKALLGLGAAYMGLKDISRASPFLQQALAIAQEVKNPQLEAAVQKLLPLVPRIVEAQRLTDLGTQQLKSNQFEAALQSFQQALPICREIKSRLGEGKALVGLGAAYMGLKDISRASPFLQQALAIAQETKNRQLEEAAHKLLSLAQLQNTPRKAEAYRLLGQGTQQLNTNQFEAALQSWQQALTIYRETSDRQGEMNVLGNLGNAYHAREDYAKAIEYLQQSLAISKGIKDPSAEATFLNNLGLSYLRLGDYAKAIDYLQPSLVIAREIIDRQEESNALNDLGVAYRNLGDYAKAIDYFQQSLALMREIQDRRGEGSALSNLGSTYLNLGDYAKAIDYYEQSLAIARSLKDRQGEMSALNNQGLVYV